MKTLLAVITTFLMLGAIQAVAVAAQGPPPDDNWRFLDGPIAPGGDVLDLAHSPASPDRLFALVGDAAWRETRVTALFRSDDGASTWRRGHAFTHGVAQLAIDPRNADVILAGGEDALYRSADGGLSWTQVYTMGQASAITPDGVYYAAGPVLQHDADCHGAVMGIARSQDSGQTWKMVHHFCATQAIRITAAPAPDNSVYVAARWSTNKREYLLRSDDGGVTWTDVIADSVDSLWLHHWLYDFVINPTDPDVLFLCDEFGLIRSLDRGVTWERLMQHFWQPDNGYPPGQSFAMSFDQQGAIIIANREAFPEAHVYRSDDNGGTWWQALETLPRGVNRLIAHPQRPGALFAGLNDFGMYASQNRGGRWTPVNQGLQTLVSVRDMVADPTNVDRVYAAVDEPGAGLFRSEDGGLSWRALITETSLSAIGLYPGATDSGWAGGANALFSFHGNDYKRHAETPGMITSIKLSSKNSNLGYLVGYSREVGFIGILQTEILPASAGFHNWMFIAIPRTIRAYDLAFPPNDPQTVYVVADLLTPGDAGKESAVLRSKDEGWTWEQILNPTYIHLSFRKIVIGDRPPYALFVMQEREFWYISNDGGATWQKRPLPSGDAYDMILDDFGAPIVSTSDGIFRWDDASSHWERIGSDAIQAHALLFARGRQPRLYAGTKRGAWARDIERAHLWLPLTSQR